LTPDLGIILRQYGFLQAVSIQQSFPALAGDRLAKVVFVSREARIPGLNVDSQDEPPNQFYYPPQRGFLSLLMKRRAPLYRALLPHISFGGRKVEPMLVNKGGRAALAWLKGENEKILLVGFDVVNEVIRYRQGDPTKAETTGLKERETWGFPGERPLYLFQGHLLSSFRTIPWADYLCFFLAETLSQLSGYPLVEPLPGGARGAVILTGDDDQAFLDKYREQLQLIGDLPMTYFLHYKTKHTKETLKNLPAHVDLGLHPDALDQPGEYKKLCAEQLAMIRELAGRPIRTLRNHGYLNDGYLGHLGVWEENGLFLDANYPGLDGTALNGSFLPMRLRRMDGSWSSHYSLLTAFGDGILSIFRINQQQAVKRIQKVASQIEGSYPGVIVFNFHPQNVSETDEMHRAVVKLGQRPGWVALGLEKYLDWLEILETLGMERMGKRIFSLRSPKMVNDLVLRYPVGNSWLRKKLDPWSGKTEVHFL
jgi:hypothetical protein